jgi:acylpyruvate hydrolase
MRLATLRIGDSTRAAVRIGDAFALLDAGDVAEFLRAPAWRQIALAQSDATVPESQADFAPLVTSARKIICCGLNYADHIRETGRDVPTFPTLFGKFNDTLAGAFDTIDLPLNSDRVDWEAELAVIVGSPFDHASEREAADAIAGYCIANDVSMRDWQQRTVQWMQGKVFSATTPLGPELVTVDEFDPTTPHAIVCEVAGSVVQASTTDELVFSASHLLSYISQFTALSPGDVVLTGTPGGVGMAATPPQYLEHGDLLVTRIAGLGELSNPIRDPRKG